jgi:hypothetical protein
MAHVFIVNKITFKYHLEYNFAGTGASNVSTDFIFDTHIKLNTQDEKRSLGMITDVSRIKIGDKILFFVTGISRFYGIFEAESEFFLDPNDSNNFLVWELGKILTYRILLKPYKVYQNGITEYDALDSLDNVNFPDEICWSLIYRKLAGNRGCTMITEQEFVIFERKLAKENILLTCSNFSFNSEVNEIVECDKRHHYSGRKLDIKNNLKMNMLKRYEDKKAFEHYIQYFTVTLLKGIDFQKLLLSSAPVSWIGNEVMCSFGEHRIDALIIQEEKNIVEISLIEMKDEKIKDSIIDQVDRYLKWIKDYILPFYLRANKKVSINPILLSDGIPFSRKSTKEKLDDLENYVSNYDWSKYKAKDVIIQSIRIIHFNDNTGNLIL